MPEAGTPSQGTRPLDVEGLASFLERLSDFDVRMNDVVIHAGALRGAGDGPIGFTLFLTPIGYPKTLCEERVMAP